MAKLLDGQTQPPSAAAARFAATAHRSRENAARALLSGAITRKDRNALLANARDAKAKAELLEAWADALKGSEGRLAV